MLRRDTADDFVIATGVKHTVRQFAEIAFDHVGLDWQKHVRVDPALLRPEDPNTLRGDIAKARRELGWEPTVALPDLLAHMVDADIERVQRESQRKTDV